MPVMYWTPSISPSTLAWYTGDKLAPWRGHLFVGALNGQTLVHGGDDGYFDPLLQLFDENGTSVLAYDDDSFFFDPAIHFELRTPGTYFLQVGECCGVGDADYLLAYASTSANATTESEPNDTPGTADPIAYGGSVTGTIDTGLVDLYAFAGTAGDMVRIQVFDAWNRQDAADFVTLELLAPDGVTPLDTGGYVNLQTATAILQTTGTHYLRIQPVGAATEYRVTLSRFQSAPYESEPNGTTAQAGLLIQRAAGVIGTPGDVDIYRLDAPAHRLAQILIYAGSAATGSDGSFEFSGHGSSLQPLLTVTDASGNVLATSTSDPVSVFTESVSQPLPTAAIAFVPQGNGPFFVRVESAFGAGSATATYVLEKR
jgi:hypothetical protein